MGDISVAFACAQPPLTPPGGGAATAVLHQQLRCCLLCSNAEVGNIEPGGDRRCCCSENGLQPLLNHRFGSCSLLLQFYHLFYLYRSQISISFIGLFKLGCQKTRANPIRMFCCHVVNNLKMTNYITGQSGCRCETAPPPGRSPQLQLQI